MVARPARDSAHAFRGNIFRVTGVYWSFFQLKRYWTERRREYGHAAFSVTSPVRDVWGAAESSPLLGLRVSPIPDRGQRWERRRQTEDTILEAQILMPTHKRPDRDGTHQAAFERNRKKILLTQDVCGICGRPVDKSLKFPHPMSPTVDHIIPIDRGGHPSAIENLQLAHFACNRQKSDKLSPTASPQGAFKPPVPPAQMRMLPLSIDWANYRE